MIDWVSRQAWTGEQNVHLKKNWQLCCLLKDTPDFVMSLKLKLDLEKIVSTRKPTGQPCEAC